RPTTAHVAAPRPGFGSACPDTVNQAGTRNANATTMPSVATMRAPRTRAEASVGAAVSVVGERRAASIRSSLRHSSDRPAVPSSTATSTGPGFFRSSRARAAGSDATSRDASGAAGAPSSAGTAGEDAAWPVSAPPGSAAPPLRGEDVAGGALVEPPAGTAAGSTPLAGEAAGAAADGEVVGVPASAVGAPSIPPGIAGTPAPAAPKAIGDVDPPNSETNVPETLAPGMVWFRATW